MLSRPIGMWRLSAVLALVAATALAQSNQVFDLQGEPGPEGDSPSLDDYYTFNDLASLVPSSDEWLTLEAGDALYALRDEAPDLSTLVTTAGLEATLGDYVTADELSEDYWTQGGVPDYDQFVSNVHASDNYAAKAMVPESFLLEANIPSPDELGWVTATSFAGQYLEADALDEALPKAVADATFLKSDVPLPDTLSDEIKAIIADELANPSCPDDSVAVNESCVDKYEATVWGVPCDELDAALASADPPVQAGLGFANYDIVVDLPRSGILPEGAAAYACSRPGLKPSVAINWFQAQAVCAQSGKRLCTNQEWQGAAMGTPASECTLTGPAVSGGTKAGCVSDAGAHDMVGNASEIIADWAPGDPPFHYEFNGSIPSIFEDVEGNWTNTNLGRNDLSVGVPTGTAPVGVGQSDSRGLPRMLLRGGSAALGAANGAPAPGLLSVDTRKALDFPDTKIGFRCCRSR